jgi:hypothetical protein
MGLSGTVGPNLPHSVVAQLRVEAATEAGSDPQISQMNADLEVSGRNRLRKSAKSAAKMVSDGKG